MKYFRTSAGTVHHIADLELMNLSKVTPSWAADTIEELVDCYVDYCYDDDSYHILDKKPTTRENHHIIYAATWSMYGLRFVATMTKEGKLILV